MKFRLAACVAAIIAGTTVSSAAEQVHSTRTVTSSDDLQLSKADHAVCLDRRQNPHATTVKLPADAEPDQEFIIDDCSGNSATFFVKAAAPKGHAISGPLIMNIDNASLRIRYFGNHAWRVEQ